MYRLSLMLIVFSRLHGSSNGHRGLRSQSNVRHQSLRHHGHKPGLPPPPHEIQRHDRGHRLRRRHHALLVRQRLQLLQSGSPLLPRHAACRACSLRHSRCQRHYSRRDQQHCTDEAGVACRLHLPALCGNVPGSACEKSDFWAGDATLCGVCGGEDREKSRVAVEPE